MAITEIESTEYILTDDKSYYPSIEYYDTYEEAKKAYDELSECGFSVLTISKVIKMKQHTED